MPEGTLGVFHQPAGPDVKNLVGQDRPAEGFQQYVTCRSRRKVSGVYIAQTGAHLVLAAADIATAGRWFLLNPATSGLFVALRRIEFLSQLGSALVAVTSPRLQVERFTFTGSPTGPDIVATKRATADAAQAAKLKSSGAGITPSAAVPLFAFLPVASATAVGYNPPGASDWNPDEDGQPVLAPQEGLIFRQPDAGTAADTRRYVTNIAWEEFTIP